MIPLRLTLKNFMSYRDGSPPVDVAPIHTACLSGDNGAGKSALLTAMTWALWGATPAPRCPGGAAAGGGRGRPGRPRFALRGSGGGAPPTP